MTAGGLTSASSWSVMSVEFRDVGRGKCHITHHCLESESCLPLGLILICELSGLTSVHSCSVISLPMMEWECHSLVANLSD